jgi:hypothetical protein
MEIGIDNQLIIRMTNKGRKESDIRCIKKIRENGMRRKGMIRGKRNRIRKI